MSTAVLAPPHPKAFTYGHDPSVMRFSVEQYQAMIEGGILDVNDHVELLENNLVLKMPRNPRHDVVIDRVYEMLIKVKPAGWRVRCQSAIELSDSQPEPDFVFARGSATEYENRRPVPDDIGVVIEIANSSLMRDRNDKCRIYARAGVLIYWIVNLVDNRVEVFTQPSGPGDDPSYASCDMLTSGQSIPLVLDGNTITTIPVNDLLS